MPAVPIATQICMISDATFIFTLIRQACVHDITQDPDDIFQVFKQCRQTRDDRTCICFILFELELFKQ